MSIECFEGELLAAKVRKHEVSAAESHIDCDDEPILSLQVQKGRFAATARFSSGALIDQALVYKLTDQQAHGSACDAHAAGEVGARDGLMLANEIECNAAINVARCSAGGDPKVLSINFAHSAAAFPNLSQICPNVGTRYIKGIVMSSRNCRKKGKAGASSGGPKDGDGKQELPAKGRAG